MPANLILAGLSEYNFKNHVALYIGVDQKYLAAENILSQTYLNTIEQWTDDNLNSKKSNVMILNFTHNFQSATRLYTENSLLEVIQEKTLFRTIISSDLTCDYANYLKIV